MEKRVTALGGIFFKAQDPSKLNHWYKEHLGLPTSEYGTEFKWRKQDEPEKEGSTIWCPFKQETGYFAPSEKDFMFNFRVENLRELLEVLKAEGVTIVKELHEDEYGGFAHIMDPEGNKIELWQPKEGG